MQLGGPRSKPTTVIVEINGQSLLMEVDSGSAVTLISQNTWQNFSPWATESMHMEYMQYPAWLKQFSRPYSSERDRPPLH